MVYYRSLEDMRTVVLILRCDICRERNHCADKLTSLVLSSREVFKW